MAAHRKPSLKLRASALTDAGPKRAENEDSFLCDTERGLFIVADGMGGRNAGEIASRAVTAVLPALLWQALARYKRLGARETKLAMKESLCRLSHDLYERSQTTARLQGLGSTAVVLLVHEGSAYLAYAGDSRAYVLRGTTLTQITQDQTTAEALVRHGHLSPEAAAQSPLRHSLEEFVGKSGALDPGVRSRRLQARERWLLCSDGITKGLSDDVLVAVLRRYMDPETTCREILTTATQADGSDNMTAIVVDVGGNTTRGGTVARRRHSPRLGGTRLDPRAVVNSTLLNRTVQRAG